MPTPLGTSKANRDSRRWTTPEQTAWLAGQTTAYAAAKADGRSCLNVFWVKLFNDWFARWPEAAAPSSLGPQANGTGALAVTEEDVEAVKKVKKVCTYCCSDAYELIMFWL